ncbi:MAG: hypothetical protein WCC67_21185, partial [Candidatus Acidiferrales bacterium]
MENTTGSAMLKSGRAIKSTRVLQHNLPNSDWKVKLLDIQAKTPVYRGLQSARRLVACGNLARKAINA